MFDLPLMALALSMDAFAVAVANAASSGTVKLRDCAVTGLYFGGFQALMPVIGYGMGNVFADYITSVDHWIALGLLAFIGGKMLWGALQGRDQPSVRKPTHGTLIIQAFATSIDALAVGVTIAIVGFSIWSAALLIGLVTFFMSTVGGVLGHKLGGILKNRAELAGGIILILIGLKIFLQDVLT